MRSERLVVAGDDALFTGLVFAAFSPPRSARGASRRVGRARRNGAPQSLRRLDTHGYPVAWNLPGPDAEYALAIHLLSQPARTQLQILEALMGEPKTFGELRPLLRGRNNNVLTKALRALREQGLIQSGLRQDLKTKTYRLTSLGKLVILRSREMLPHHESIEAYRRGLRAST